MTEKKIKKMVEVYDPRHLARFQMQHDSIRGALKAAEQRRDEVRDALRRLEDAHRNRFETKVPTPRRAAEGALLNPAFGHLTTEDNRLQKEAFPEEFAQSLRQVERAQRADRQADLEIQRLRACEQKARVQLDRIKRYIADQGLRPAGIVDEPAETIGWPEAAKLPRLRIDQMQQYVLDRREAIKGLVSKKDAIGRRPLPKGALVAAVDEELGRCSVPPRSATIDYAASPGGSARNLIVAQLDGAAAVAGMMQIQPWLFLAIHGAGVRALLMQRIEAFYEAHGPGLSESERAAERSAVEREIATQNILEEAAIRLSESEGLLIERRLDADCLALIGPVWRREIEPEKLPLAAGIAPIGV